MKAVSLPPGETRPIAGAEERPQIRPWRPGDLQRLVASESLYSAETCARRFLIGQQRLPSHYIAGLRRLESARNGWLAQVAVDRNRLVALAECVWDPGGSEPPELAIMVADAWQRFGLGRRTLGGLIRRCRESRLTTFGAEYLQSNPAVRLLAGSLVDEMGPSWSVQVFPGTGTHRMIISFGPEESRSA